MKRLWFCEECAVAMEKGNGDFCKCPSCGAEVWEDGEGDYRGDRQEAEVAQKIHGKWFCQTCREEMQPIDGSFCKCPSCGAEVWYGDRGTPYKPEELESVMEDAFGGYVSNKGQDVFWPMIGGRPVKGKGSRNSGRRKEKEKMRKPTTEQLYERLKKNVDGIF